MLKCIGYFKIFILISYILFCNSSHKFTSLILSNFKKNKTVKISKGNKKKTTHHNPTSKKNACLHANEAEEKSLPSSKRIVSRGPKGCIIHFFKQGL